MHVRLYEARKLGKDITEEQMIRYLLHDLNEELSQGIEERCLADSDFSELLDALEDDVVVLYLKDRLSAGDTRLFEAAYATAPQRRKVAEVARLRGFFTERPEVTPETAAGAEGARGGVRGTGLTWFLLAPGFAQGPSGADTVEVPADTAAFGLRLPLDVDDECTRYAVALKTPDHREAWGGRGLEAEETDTGRELRIRLPAGELSAGDYVIFVTGTRPDGEDLELDAYSLRLAR